MCKETGQSFLPSKNEHGPMREGKTKRDHESGAHARLLQNRDSEAQENKRFHNKGA